MHDAKAEVIDARIALQAAKTKLRKEIVAAVDAGYSIALISRESGVTRQTIYTWLELKEKVT